MSKQYRVTNSDVYENYKLKVGDIVTKIEGPTDSNFDLYELPEHLHGRGHNASLYDGRLELKEPNYLYIYPDDLEEIKEN